MTFSRQNELLAFQFFNLALIAAASAANKAADFTVFVLSAIADSLYLPVTIERYATGGT